MSLADTIKGLVLKKKPGTDPLDPRRVGAPMPGGRREGEAENPYLAARRTWNHHHGEIIARGKTGLFVGILSLLIALAAVGGMTYIGSQSKFIPYVVQVDKQGSTVAAGPAQAADKADPRVVHAAISDWLACARLVTPDVALQRRCVYKVYSMLSPNDPATAKMNEFLNGTPDSTPFKRAEKELVTAEIKTVLAQTPNTWQVEWEESIRDRQGVLRSKPVTMRALVTVYIAEVTSSTTDEQLRNNPLGVYVRDYSWARIQ